MSKKVGRLVCPKCKNMNMIFISHSDGNLRCFNSYECTINNGNILWDFGFNINDKEYQFSQDKKTEEQCKNLFKLWICPKAGFTGKNFINGMGCGYSSNLFLDFIPKIYEEKDFSNKKLISRTNYGKVYSAYSIKDKEEVCLKIIDTEQMEFDYQQNNLKDYKSDLNNEINILTLFGDNENSVKYYGCYDKGNEKVIITEKCDLNLREFILKKGNALTPEEIKKNFFSINKILKILQERLIIHRDLKLENFLVKYKNNEKTEYIIKLSDYGISKFKNNTNGIFSGIKGSEDTIAPEISLNKVEHYESCVDIFSLGIVFYQLSHNLKHPFGSNFNDCYINYKLHFENDDLNVQFDQSIQNENFKDLLRKMLRLNPKNRIIWDDYFNHPFFQ